VIRVGRVAAGHDRRRRSAGVDGHHFDGLEVIDREPELAAQEAERAAGDMTADADGRMFAERNDDAPALVQRLVRLADRGAGLDFDGEPPRVPGDAPHRRQVDDHARVRVGDEPFEAMPAARGHQPAPGADRLVHCGNDLRRRADGAYVVGAAAEALVDLAIQHGAVARVVGSEAFAGISGMIGHGHRL
jgi:hypothetical protein